MKVLIRTLSLLVIASLTLFFANCGGGEAEKDPEEVQLEKLSKTWNIVSASYGSPATDRTADFTGFTLTFSGSFDSGSPKGPYDYDVTGSRPDPSPWPDAANGNGGTWTFVATPDGDSGFIVRDDDIGMEYTIDGDELTITFNFTGTGYDGARAAQVKGDWTFVFN